MITPRPPYLPFQQIAARVEDLRQKLKAKSKCNLLEPQSGDWIPDVGDNPR